MGNSIMEILQWFVEWFANYGEFGLILMAFAESSFFPIPPDVLLIPMCITNPHLSILYALLCTIGSVVGGGFGYGIGQYGGRPLVTRFFSKEKIDAADQYYQKYGLLAVAVAGFTPIPYKIFSITSGLFKFNFFRFVLVSIMSRGGRFFLLGIFLYIWGESVKVLISKYFGVFSILFVILLLGGFWVVHLFVKRNKGKDLENA